MSPNTTAQKTTAEAYAELEQDIFSALKTYSNVHRGSGHNARITTHLFEQAREIVLDFLQLDKGKYIVIFCTPRRETLLKEQLDSNSFQAIGSQEIGLSLGVRALAVKSKALKKLVPVETGGGTTKLISRDWVIWADAPDKFEAGTPAIINVIAFARALQLIAKYGKDIFKESTNRTLTAEEILYHDELEQYKGSELLGELRKTHIGRDVLVSTIEGERPFINFDNSASTPTFEPVWEAFKQSWRQSKEVKQEIIQEVKSILSKALNAPLSDYEVIFTSNTTESINITAQSLGCELEEGIESIVLNTIMEHSSNDLPWRRFPAYSLMRMKVDAEGFIDISELETLLRDYNQEGKYGKKRIKLVTVSGASNVLGICNNIDEISTIVHKYGARLMVDSAQLVAHRKVDIEKCNIDYLAFSAHKVYTPFGCGVLIVKKGLLTYDPAEMEIIRSSGEENAGGICALGKAILLLQRIGMDIIKEEEQELTRKLLLGMAKIPNLRLFGVKDPDSSGFAHKLGVIVFDIKGKMPSKTAKELDKQGGIGVRSGCHCAHIIIKHLLKITPFLEKFQYLIQILFPRFRFLGLVRISLGLENTEEEVDAFLRVLNTIAKK